MNKKVIEHYANLSLREFEQLQGNNAGIREFALMRKDKKQKNDWSSQCEDCLLLAELKRRVEVLS